MPEQIAAKWHREGLNILDPKGRLVATVAPGPGEHESAALMANAPKLAAENARLLKLTKAADAAIAATELFAKQVEYRLGVKKSDVAAVRAAAAAYTDLLKPVAAPAPVAVPSDATTGKK